MNRNRFSTLARWVAIGLPAFAADPAPVVDRGLPQANLNNISGPARSNVRWTSYDQGFVGDDFAVGAPGERWVVDAIRTWVVPGSARENGQHLGDFYQDVRLYFGGPAGDLTPVAAARMSPGSDQTENANVRISEATQAGALLYDDFGTSLRIWQVDFANLNLAIEGGTKYRFGAWGAGRAVPGTDAKTFAWFNHASNAALSSARQDGADGVLLLFDAAGRSEGTLAAQGNGWDKPADINVQVFAHRVDGSGSPRLPASR
jgi:hypothetical protein